MKDYRDKEMVYLLIVYILLMLLWCTDFDVIIKNNTDLVNSVVTILNIVTILGVLSLVTFILDSMIDTKIKDKLVGFFIKERPGITIFSRINSGSINDDRFTIDEAKIRYKDIIDQIPKEKENKSRYENSHWYKIYFKFQDNHSIMQSQKDYLLCRDLYIETLIFIILYLISTIVFKEILFFSSKYLIFLLTILVITNISTHIKMHRFVNNVIAADLSSNHEI